MILSMCAYVSGVVIELVRVSKGWGEVLMCFYALQCVFVCLYAVLCGYNMVYCVFIVRINVYKCLVCINTKISKNNDACYKQHTYILSKYCNKL